MRSLLRTVTTQLRHYPSAIVGLFLISLFVVLALSAFFIVPYSEAIEHWRGTEDVVGSNPRNAKPLWSNWFRSEKLPVTLNLSSLNGEGETERVEISEDIFETITTYEFDFAADRYPSELSIIFYADYEEKPPFVEMTWITPDGREIKAGQLSPIARDQFRFSQNDRVIRDLGVATTEEGFFRDPEITDSSEPLKGTYTLVISALHFEENSTIESDFTLFGEVFGWAGTDHRRRDLSVALLWGSPIAMAFGLIAAVSTTASAMIIAAISVWYGGWVDSVIQRVHEVFLTLPFLSILIMIGTFYSRNIWNILGATIILFIFTSGIKGYRALFLQVRELGYIEAAQTYGASNMRIIFRYLIPRAMPLLVPALISLVPTFVFIEATLASFGLGDPVLPTWGKVIDDARSNGAVLNGHYYWMLQPTMLLLLLGIGFTALGTALDNIFNPRLRQI